MTTRNSAPVGAPCWVDLWTSDAEGSRRFYPALFGWEALEADPAFGGYFMFARRGVGIAGAMGSMGDMVANDTWKPYLCTDDVTKTLEGVEAAGGQIGSPVMPVGDLGRQAVVSDPSGAVVGLWQPGTWPGFTVIGEHGALSWFELHTRDYAGSVAFYRDVFGLLVNPVADTDEFRYSTLRSPGDDTDLAGIADASSWLAEGEPGRWSIYWEVDDVDAAAARVTELGGAVRQEPEATPYGRLATVTDPAGAEFRLRAGKG